MNLAHLPFGIGDGIIMLVAAVYYLLPLVLVILALKWLYQSKKSLASIDATLGELRDIAKTQAGNTETTHE